MAKRSRPVDARSETVAAVFQQIPQHYERFVAFHKAVKEGVSVLAQRCSKALTAVERKKQELKEKEEKERRTAEKTVRRQGRVGRGDNIRRSLATRFAFLVSGPPRGRRE
jgi:hypothetical protein